MASNENWWRNDRGRRDNWTSGERDVRDLGSHRDYGRDMLDDMRRYARGGSGSDDDRRRSYGSDWSGRGDEGQDYARGGYGRSDYGRGGGGRDSGRDSDRGFFDRAGDEMASWFGDDDAARRRRMDAQQGDSGAQHHRGRGPRGYTRSDERIREDVNDRLTDDPYVDASDIEVSVSSCEVTLSGTVDDRRARRRAEDIAESVSGVSHVQNNLRVRQTAGNQSMTGSTTTAGAGAMAGMGSGMGTGMGSASGGTGTTGTTGRTDASATEHTADTDSITRR